MGEREGGRGVRRLVWGRRGIGGSEGKGREREGEGREREEERTEMRVIAKMQSHFYELELLFPPHTYYLG